MFIVDSNYGLVIVGAIPSPLLQSNINIYILRIIDARSSSLLQIESSQARVAMPLLERQIKDFGAVALGIFSSY